MSGDMHLLAKLRAAQVFERADMKGETLREAADLIASLQSRLDSAQKLARAAWDAKSEGAMWQALSRIIDALEGTAVERQQSIGPCPVCRSNDTILDAAAPPSRLMRCRACSSEWSASA